MNGLRKIYVIFKRAIPQEFSSTIDKESSNYELITAA